MWYFPTCNVSECCIGRNYWFCSDAQSLFWPAFQRQLYPVSTEQLRVYMLFHFGTPVTDWLLALSAGCGTAGDPCRACCPPAVSWRWEILPPSLPFLHRFTLLFICLFSSSLSTCLFYLLSGLYLIYYYCSVNMIKANGGVYIVSQHGRAEKRLGAVGRTPD